MVAFEEENRPNIEEILKDNWFKEINDLNNDEKLILEEQVRLEFKKREEDIIKKTQIKENVKEKDRVLEDKNEIFEYFKNNINIKLINAMEMDNYIKIIGELNPIEFMNQLAFTINYYYGCKIEPSHKSLKFNAIFTKIEEEEEEEELDFNNINENDKTCIIQVKLFKSEKNVFILRFIKKLGELNHYYHNLFNIIDKARKLL